VQKGSHWADLRFPADVTMQLTSQDDVDVRTPTKTKGHAAFPFLRQHNTITGSGKLELHPDSIGRD
jgi:hypothetical protein